jgi:hypothetical protein
MSNFLSNIMSSSNSASRILFYIWIITSFILFWVWFGSTVEIPDRFDNQNDKIRDAKAAAKGFGIVTLLLPIILFIIIGIINLFK